MPDELGYFPVLSYQCKAQKINLNDATVVSQHKFNTTAGTKLAVAHGCNNYITVILDSYTAKITPVGFFVCFQSKFITQRTSNS